MSLTVDIDVTNLKAYSKQTGSSFYPLMLWAVSKVINRHDEFKYSWDGEGNLIRWDFVSPSYTDFHSEDENFTKLVTEYSDDLTEFYGRVMADRERYKNDRAILDHHLQTSLTFPAYPGYGINTLMSMFSMKANSLRLWLPWANTSRWVKDCSCP